MPTRKNRPYPSGYYGQAHKAMRRRLAPIVATGTVECARCGELIEPGTPWQLDHRDDGRGWLGARLISAAMREQAGRRWSPPTETLALLDA